MAPLQIRHFRPAGYGVEKGFDLPAVQEAMQLPRAQAFMRWSRFPFVQVNPTEPQAGVWLNDYRYAKSDGGNLKTPLGTLVTRQYQRITQKPDEKAVTVWVALPELPVSPEPPA